MGELITTLRNSRDVYAEKLRQLLVNYQKYPDALYCVFEGEDAKYYGIRIDSLSDFEDRRQMPCRGKEDVLKLHDRVMADERLMLSNTIFFVDYDFDGLRGHSNGPKLYVTPCYSVENLYVRERAFKRILVEEYGVEDFNTEAELVRLLSIYSKLLDEFAKALTTLNAWIALQREKERPGARLNLNNRKLKHFVSISLEKVEQLYSKSELSLFFPNAVDITDEELAEKESEFEHSDKLNAYRGKYFIEFLRIFLELLKNDRQNSSPKYFEQSQKVKLTLSGKNILSELSQYADTPECLKEFIGNVSQKFRQNQERGGKRAVAKGPDSEISQKDSPKGLMLVT